MLPINPIFTACIAAIILFLIIPIGILISRIIFPTILSYPWFVSPENSRQRKREKDMTVVLAGSFNPPHWGHLVMIRYLAERYGRVICCIGVNPNKIYDVTPLTRAQLLREMLTSNDANDGTGRNMGASCKNVQVEVVSGYIWRYAKKQNASIFYRGIRTWEADGAEERQLQILNSWGPLLLGPTWPLKTLFLEGDPRYRDVSSTLVRQICARGRANENDENKGKESYFDELSRLVPECVTAKVAEVYGN